MVGSSSAPPSKPTDEEMVLQTLPYDLLLNVAQYLDLQDVHALQIVSMSVL